MEHEFVECRLFNGAVYARTDKGDLFQLRHTIDNHPKIVLVVASAASPFRWPEWLEDAPTAKAK